MAVAAEEPKIAATVGPTDCGVSISRDIAARSDTLRSIDAGCTWSVAAAYPRPLIGRRAELPQIIQDSKRSRRIVAAAYPAEEPEIAAAVGPTDCGVSTSRGVAGGSDTLRTKDGQLV